MAVEQAIPDEDRWPGVALAYEFVRPSYEIMLKRFEVIEGRVRALVTLTGTLTFAAPVLIRALQPESALTSPWFILAIVAALLVVALGAVATVFWTVRMYSPQLLYAEYLEMSEWEFRKNMVFWAGDAFAKNAASLRRKGGIADAISVLLLAELSLLVVWGLYPG